MSCYCSATPMPPCSWCENSYECEICGKLKNQSEDPIGASENNLICCDSCLEALALQNAANFGAHPCNCETRDLLMNGCKCGGT